MDIYGQSKHCSPTCPENQHGFPDCGPEVLKQRVIRVATRFWSPPRFNPQSWGAITRRGGEAIWISPSVHAIIRIGVLGSFHAMG